MNKKRRIILLVIVGMLLLIFFYLIFKFIFPRGKNRPNIVLVIMDTVRSDYTDLKIQVNLTPQLKKLAKEGTVFSNAWSNAPWTVPSHASIFTGLLPSEHGCDTKNFCLSTKHTTSAEILSSLGYETAGFFSNPWLSDLASGLMRGFQIRKEIWIGGLDRLRLGTGDQGGFQVNHHIEKWLKNRSQKKPFFLFVNYLEAHLPYDPLPEYRQKYLKNLNPDDMVSIRWAHEFNAGLYANESTNWEKIRRLYAGDVNSSDRLLGSLISLLKEYGVYKESVVIVTSDHGEHLGEHGLVEHQFSVYEPVLFVPLVIRAPAVLKTGVNLKPVMLSDLFATVVEIGGGKKPAGLIFSQSVLETEINSRTENLPKNDNGCRYLISEYAGAPEGLLVLFKQINPQLDTGTLQNSYRTITDGRWRYTVSSDQKKMLFNLQEDPDQVFDFSSRFPIIVSKMERAMKGIFSRINDMETEGKKLDPETRKKLESLGYIQ